MSRNGNSTLGQKKKAEATRHRLEQQFMEFAGSKGWDEDRRIQVLAELAYSDPWHEMLDECVEAGWTDGLIQQLKEYYGSEADHYTRMLQRIVDTAPTGPVDVDLLGRAIAKLGCEKEVKGIAQGGERGIHGS